MNDLVKFITHILEVLDQHFEVKRKHSLKRIILIAFIIEYKFYHKFGDRIIDALWIQNHYGFNYDNQTEVLKNTPYLDLIYSGSVTLGIKKLISLNKLSKQIVFELREDYSEFIYNVILEIETLSFSELVELIETFEFRTKNRYGLVDFIK